MDDATMMCGRCWRTPVAVRGCGRTVSSSMIIHPSAPSPHRFGLFPQPYQIYISDEAYCWNYIMFICCVGDHCDISMSHILTNTTSLLSITWRWGHLRLRRPRRPASHIFARSVTRLEVICQCCVYVCVGRRSKLLMPIVIYYANRVNAVESVSTWICFRSIFFDVRSFRIFLTSIASS